MLDKDEARKQKIAQKPINGIDLHFAYEYTDSLKEYFENVDKAETRDLAVIDKKAKAMFSDKTTLSYLRNLVIEAHESAKNNMLTILACDCIYTKMEILSKAVVVLLDKVKELPDAKDVRELKDLQQRLTVIDSIMQQVQSRITANDKNAEPESKAKDATKTIIGDSSYVR